MSYVLRHKPDSVGITLDQQGWTTIEVLLSKLNITRSELDYVVSNNSKNRFAISVNGLKIRANQGHSIKIELGLLEKEPPEILFHGTAVSNLEQIMVKGLHRMSRNHVHLSTDIETAKQVGTRHGKPVVLAISSKVMADDGILFYQSENGVWLTSFVAPKYFSVL